MMAINLDETGVKGMFLAIFREAMYKLEGEQDIKTPAGFKSVNPSMWHDQLNVQVNVGLGNGRIEEKIGRLDQLLQFQMQVLQQYGPTSPFMGWENIRNTVKTRLRLVVL